MIQIDAIRIRDFRGVRELELSLEQKNFGSAAPTEPARAAWSMPSSLH